MTINDHVLEFSCIIVRFVEMAGYVGDMMY